MAPVNIDSEREEGEIIDDLDDLSDISSEEEYLLRQRLQVLESYNNVLERKEAKRSSVQLDHNVAHSEKRNANGNAIWYDLPKISGTELNEKKIGKNNKQRKESKRPKTLKHSLEHDSKRKKIHPVVNEIEPVIKHKDQKKKHHKIKTKKKVESKLISDSSDETDYEYRNKRRKLQDAVNVHGSKTDSSLTDRIKKMLGKPGIDEHCDVIDINDDASDEVIIVGDISDQDKFCDNRCNINSNKHNDTIEVDSLNKSSAPGIELKQIDNLCTDIVSEVVVKDSINDKPESRTSVPEHETSDEDLELLRQNALQTKSSKLQPIQPILPNTQSEDEDSDTAELRQICLKSALLKKAIEMKRKQKLRKRLSQSFNMEDPLLSKLERQDPDNSFSGNNTDIESVDMDLGVSDEPDDDKRRDITDNLSDSKKKEDETGAIILDNYSSNIEMSAQNEIEEDEDLLRAQLLTSLSKNMPKLMNANVTKTEQIIQPKEPLDIAKTINENAPEEKRFIINIGDSDSGSDNEATKNLTKMHLKLSEQMDFQQKLDIFLKSTRLEVENKKTLPDLIQEPALAKTIKFVPKAVNHLPKSEQLEYNNLVKRMAELEKFKKTRQAAMQSINAITKDTLKPRNVTIDTTLQNTTYQNLEEQIALSRKKIADESVKVLKLKDEGKKLSQKFKIVATELRNIKTALTLNKREQRTAHITLSKIRAQHQLLLKRSTMALHSNPNSRLLNISNNKMIISRLQKENEPLKGEIKNLQVLKSVKVNFVNDYIEKPNSNKDFSICVDVSNNKRLIRGSKDKSPVKDMACHIDKEINDDLIIPDQNENSVSNLNANNKSSFHSELNKESAEELAKIVQIEHIGEKSAIAVQESNLLNKSEVIDYQSPLQAIKSGSWNEDPHAVLCRFEVGGSCKDPDCKFLHPKLQYKH